MRWVSLLAVTVLLGVGTIPAAAQSSDLETAGKQFQKYCKKCHGPEGKGDGPEGATLRQKPKNLTNCPDMAKETDDGLFKVIKEGGEPYQGQRSEMPAMGKSLSDDEIRSLVAFVRGFCKAH